MATGHSSGNGHQAKALMRERRTPQERPLAERIDRAVALADQETGVRLQVTGDSGYGRPASEGERGYRGTPGGDISPMAVAAPVAGGQGRRDADATARWARDPKMKAAVLGVPGTPITSGFLTDLGEYNPELMGRNAIRSYEKMRRGDAQVRATLAACKLPVLSAKWEIVPLQEPVPQVKTAKKVSTTGQGYTTGAKAKEVAEFVKENLFGGLEFRSATGALVSQAWQDVVYNALLMLDFGCSVHEDVWMVDGDKLRLRRLAARHPITYYRWDVEEDGETLDALIQYGYRKAQFLNVPLPSDKMCLFNYQQEAANFWGIALSRAMYPHWYYKSKLYAIDAIANERNSLGIPVFRLSPGFSSEDKATAYNFVTQLASHEATGLVEPPSNGEQDAGLRIVGYQGRLRDVLPSVAHHNVMISRAALALFMDLGQAEHGSRALGKQHGDFFLLALQNVADLIAQRLTCSSLRRLVEFNFGEGAPMPKLVAANVQSRGLEEMVGMLSQLAQTGLVVSDKPLRDYIRSEGGLPEETKEDLVAIRGETVSEGAGSAEISGRSAGAVGERSPQSAGASRQAAGSAQPSAGQQQASEWIATKIRGPAPEAGTASELLLELPGAGHWVTIDGRHVLIDDDEVMRPEIKGALRKWVTDKRRREVRRLQEEARGALERGGETDPTRSEGEAILHGIRHGAYTEDPLYRGFHSGEEKWDRLKPADPFDYGEPRSFSFDEETGRRFSQNLEAPSEKRYVIQLHGGAKGLPVRLHLKRGQLPKREEELITGGRFRVTGVETKQAPLGPIRYIHAEQEGVL